MLLLILVVARSNTLSITPRDGDAQMAEELASRSAALSGGDSAAAGNEGASGHTDHSEDASVHSEPASPTTAAASSQRAGGTSAEAVASSPKPFDLDVELALVRTMSSFGLVGNMMEVLYNITLELADTDGDGKLSATEAQQFVAKYVQPSSKICVQLGLGKLPLTDRAAVAAFVGETIRKCDTDSDSLLDRTELRGCTRYLYERMYKALAPKAAQSGAAADRPAASERTGESTTRSRSSPRAGGAFGGERPGQRAAAMQLPFQSQINRLTRAVQANLRSPNLNTLLGGLGIAAFTLREGLSLDVLSLRKRLRGLVGADLPDFLARLRNVGLGLFLAAAFGNFDNLG